MRTETAPESSPFVVDSVASGMSGSAEDDAGRGGVCDQATLVVDDPTLGGRGGAADVDDGAGGSQSATIGRDGADVVDLQFQCGATYTGFHGRVHRRAHHRVQQRRADAT